ncbi:AMP-binding protein, partial [Klebsiella pneumoniae]|uniref:AMP-binding protein n=1 Tax=Klebsiella pneumoniae TaxID=573 RepID=UPI0025A1CBC5
PLLRGVSPGASSPTVLVVGEEPVPPGCLSYERFAGTEPDTPARDDHGLDDIAWMLFTSGTTSKPKGVLATQRNCLWSVAYARYWHLCERDGLHFTISETGWGKALWGKLYGQWLCEGAVFTYDFDRFDA